MTSTLAQTPLFAWHAAHGGRMVDFAGWSMPVQYASIVGEHQATRQAVGIFDVSHMGRFRVTGRQAETFLNALVTRRVAGMKPGQIRYSLVTNDQGGILDDVLVYHLLDAEGQSVFVMVVNASNRQKIWDHLADHRGGADIDLCDTTLDESMIAVQGPRALEMVRPLTEVDPATLRNYTGLETRILGEPAILSRTGYTGEDGCELIVSADDAPAIWQRLIATAEAVGGKAAGLGARDTLRLEAGMPLYGHELSEQINPYQAGLGWAVDLQDRSFPGRDALAALRDDERLPRRAGWKLSGKRVPREGYAVLHEGHRVGHVTSGTFSPTLGVPLAMGYVRGDLAAPGVDVLVDIRGSHEPARSVQLPFYRRNR